MADELGVVSSGTPGAIGSSDNAGGEGSIAGPAKEIQMEMRSVLFVSSIVVGLVLAIASAEVRAESDWIDKLDAGCDAGNGQDCANLGAQLMGGYVVDKDPVRARAALEKGCRLDDLSACVRLYQALSLGEGGPADPERARGMEGKVCNTGIISFDAHLKANGLCRG